jgi:hypothetical protein
MNAISKRSIGLCLAALAAVSALTSCASTINHGMSFAPIARELPASASSILYIDGATRLDSTYAIAKSFSFDRTVKRQFKDTNELLIDLNEQLLELKRQNGADAAVNLKISLLQADMSELVNLRLLSSPYVVVGAIGAAGMLPLSIAYAILTDTNIDTVEQIKITYDIASVGSIAFAGAAAAGMFFLLDHIADTGQIIYTYRVEGDLVKFIAKE